MDGCTASCHLVRLVSLRVAELAPDLSPDSPEDAKTLMPDSENSRSSTPGAPLADAQVASEPFRRQAGHLFQGTGLFEQVTGAGNYPHVLHALELPISAAVHLDDWTVISPDDQQCGRRNLGQYVFHQIRAGTVLGKSGRESLRAAGAVPSMTSISRIVYPKPSTTRASLSEFNTVSTS